MIAFLKKLVTPKAPPLTPLWNRIVTRARAPHWYLHHGVPDTLDGRFDMVALHAAFVLLRLEADGLAQESVWLTERFVDDMDGSLREIGISDQNVGKEVGNMIGALGGRLGACREALAAEDVPTELAEVVRRNVFRGEDPAGHAPGLAEALLNMHAHIAAVPADRLLAGEF